MCRQIHGQTLQDDATCPAPHMSQLVANHHILTEHGRILSDDHSPEEFLSGWMGQQVQSSVKSRKSNVRQACNRPYPYILKIVVLELLRTIITGENTQEDKVSTFQTLLKNSQLAKH